MVDFTSYQPPGVFVEEDLSTLVGVTGIQPTVVSLVGPGRGYRIGNDTLVMDDDTGIPLSGGGVDTGTVVVTGTDGTVHALTTDYTLITSPEDATLTEVVRVDAAGIDPSDTVFVTYQYTDSDYYNPLRVYDFDDATAAYGPAIDLTTGVILSPLSFAAKVAFDNGCRELVLVATTGDVDIDVAPQDLIDAYAKLEAVYDVNIVVPLPVGITGSEGTPGNVIICGTDLETHLVNMASDELFRIGIYGVESTVTVFPTTIASGIANKRVILAWPNILRYYHGFTNTTSDVSGYYLAVAYAGRIASNPEQMPLTKKLVRGFNGFPAATAQTMTVAKKNEWSSGGVAVTEVTRTNNLQVRHGVTTDMSTANTREISLVRSRDSLIELVQTSLSSAGLVGSWIDGDTPGQVKSVVAGALEAAVGNDLIVSYTDLKARQLVGDPSVIEVKFQYKPAYPLNYIVVSFSINTETGETTLTDEGA